MYYTEVLLFVNMYVVKICKVVSATMFSALTQCLDVVHNAGMRQQRFFPFFLRHRMRVGLGLLWYV